MKKYFLLPMLLILNACGETKLSKAEYKITKEEDSIGCIKPHSIDKINKIFIKNENNEDVYMVEIIGGDGSCSWMRDKILFKEGSPASEVNSIVQNYDFTLYLKTNLNIIFKVTKLLDKNLNIKSIKVPYFVVFVNNNNVIKTINEEIKIPLTTKTTAIYYGDNMSFKQSFSVKDFSAVEILTGIYFKQ